MKKKLIIIAASTIASMVTTTYAANYLIYNSPSQCNAAMYNYNNLAQNTAAEYTPYSTPYNQFMKMSQIFNTLKGGGANINCNANTCIYSAAVCTFATTPAVWNTLILPILEQEINQTLLLGKYDANIPAGYVINCTYPNGSNINWNNCTIDKLS